MVANRPLEGKSILLVDDDPDMIAALRMVLDDSGASLETAADGNAALARAEQFEPDLVILDAMLPKRSGFLVLEKLKPLKKRGGKPAVIMITGNQGKRHQLWAESLGVDGYMNKPFRMDRLVEAVESLLGPKDEA
jgi:two-component system OmpR family response regulator